jgi:hypothetical protein
LAHSPRTPRRSSHSPPLTSDPAPERTVPSRQPANRRGPAAGTGDGGNAKREGALLHGRRCRGRSILFSVFGHHYFRQQAVDGGFAKRGLI